MKYKIALLVYSDTPPKHHTHGKYIIIEGTQGSTTFYSVVYQCGDRSIEFNTLEEAKKHLDNNKRRS